MDLISGLGNIIFQVLIVIFVIAFLFFKLGGKFGTKSKVVNRAEIIKKKLISNLNNNKSNLQVLKQKDNIIGITKNIGYYMIGGKKLFIILYMPRLISNIPKFWDKKILIISQDYIENMKEETDRYINLWYNKKFKIGTRIMNNLVIKEDYFIDEYFNININFTDNTALDFLKIKLKADESEISSSVWLAQANRLSIIDFGKIYEPTSKDIEIEKLKETNVNK